jgi:hypothetical protein
MTILSLMRHRSNADVVIVSATLPVTLIWIKHREIGAVIFANGESP